MESVELHQSAGYLGDTLRESDYADLERWERANGPLRELLSTHIYTMLPGTLGQRPFINNWFPYDWIFNNKGVEHGDKDAWKSVTFETELGSCFEINDDAHLTQSFSGVDGGLMIDLDANVNDYLPATSSRGFQVGCSSAKLLAVKNLRRNVN